MSTPQWPANGESGGQPAPGRPYGASVSQQQSVPYPPGGYSGGGQTGYAAPPAYGYQQAPGGPGQQNFQQLGYGQGNANQQYSPQQYSPQQSAPTGSTHIVAGVLLLIGGLAAAVVAGLVWLEVGATELFGAIFGAGLPNLFKTAIDSNIILTTSVVFGALTALLAIVMMTRVAGVRIPLAVLGIIGTLYYAYQVVYYLTGDISDYIDTSDLVVPIVALVIWLAGTVMTLLPGTARAMK